MLPFEDMEIVRPDDVMRREKDQERPEATLQTCDADLERFKRWRFHVQSLLLRFSVSTAMNSWMSWRQPAEYTVSGAGKKEYCRQEPCHRTCPMT